MFDPSTKILVVDDFLSMRKAVVNNCKDLGMTNIVEAADGLEAWRLLDTANPPYGLVISDITMPNMTGLQLLTKARADARFAKLPIMLITAEGEQDYVLTAAKSGVSGYILKPFTPEIFVEKLKGVYKRHFKG